MPFEEPWPQGRDSGRQITYDLEMILYMYLVPLFPSVVIHRMSLKFLIAVNPFSVPAHPQFSLQPVGQQKLVLP